MASKICFIKKFLLASILFFVFAYNCFAQTAGDYLKQGELDAKVGNLNAAISDYTKATEINPNLLDAYIGRSNIYDAQGRFNQAISDCNKAIQIKQTSAAAYVNCGIAYQGKKDYTNAISDYTRAIELNPELALAYCYRGEVYFRQNNFSQAITNYTKAIELNPYYVRAFNLRGEVFEKQGNPDHAISDYYKAIEINNKFVGTTLDQNAYVSGIDGKVAISYEALAYAYFDKKDFNNAWTNFHKAESLEYKPDKEDLEFLAKLKKASGRDN